MTQHKFTALPSIIQGGMGVGVSNWKLARAVSMTGQLGVVSGTCIDTVLVRRLQDGDPDGQMRYAMQHFPFPEIVAEVLKKYFLPNGREPGQQYKLVPLYQRVGNLFRERLNVLASFVEVFLAKHGHSGLVGINLLTKIQMPNLSAIYGGMLAGVDFILMGAGIPREIPGAINKLHRNEKAALKLDMIDSKSEEAEFFEFDPRAYFPHQRVDLIKPKFLPIISTHTLAAMFVKKVEGDVDGFVVEGPKAGGHNAPPRGTNAQGIPEYGPRDECDFQKMTEIGRPYWIAGDRARPEGLIEAKKLGAVGIQVGTLFAFSEESGIELKLKHHVIAEAKEGKVKVNTDFRASPTGFPFKTATVSGTMTDSGSYAKRGRICDLGYLRSSFKKDAGGVGFRCASEPQDDFVKKGGDIADTEGRHCLCNALFATIGIGQLRDRGENEPPLVTSGDQLEELGTMPFAQKGSYHASEVVKYLTGE